MSLETIFGLINLDKIAEVLFSLLSAFFSLETFTILYMLILVGGILFTFEYFFVKAYRLTIQATSGVMVDLDLTAPTEVALTGERVVVTPDTVEAYTREKQDLTDAQPFVDEVDKFIRFITLLQIVITLPFSLIYVPLIQWSVRRKMQASTPKKQIRTMLQLFYASNKITAVIKWLWTSVFRLFVALIMVILVVLLLLRWISSYLGGVLE